MYHDEIHHLGRPHFHARYADDEASIDIDTLAIIAGELPPRAVRLVTDWARQHQAELKANWDLARRHQPLRSIDPLRCASTIETMRSTPMLLEAEPLDGCAVRVRFEDGTTAEVDLAYLLEYGGVFEPLRDPDYFRRLRADHEAGTIVWPNGADIAPETLYAAAQERAAAVN